MARSRIARLFPTLPPSASSASAGFSAMAAPHQRDADIVECRGDRRMRFVNRDPHRTHAWEIRKHRIGHPAGGGLDQTIAFTAECFAHAIDDLIVGDCVDDFVGARRGGKLDLEIEIELERLSDFRLMRHHAVIGVECQSADKDTIAHCAASMAAATRNACTVSFTSWTRTIAAPFSTARRCAERDPPIRSSGCEATTELMKRLREAPTSSGKPKRLNSASRAMQTMLCSGVLPNPMPGSSTMFSRAIPARDAISSEREKKAMTSATMSIAASAFSRLCITMTGTPRLATSGAMSGSRCKPQTSL